MSRFPLAVALAALIGLHSATASAASDEELVADILTGVIPLGAYGIAYFKDDDQGEKQWFYSTATSLVLNTALRVAFNETSWGERPNGHPYGFPSGHTSFIVSGAAFLSERYGWKYGVPAYLASAYVAHVRVDTDHHRWRDVIAASALSWGVSHWLVTPYRDDQARLLPIIGSDEVGLLWEKRF
ncbi:phosphatase PAP2 family protein [Solimonas sp. K1W22B-7]|uniref:phosphatase PAP2 family protein n=1 Tax=Solimonas sp. K1W22B-7 TaxID=2303331 RepID=UPI000E3344FA|nr:phosphatase PAP2 family protein [Solimonas sp. K1W22B-7]AXQ30394.1 phosphatase PAP2 family protein [Solimonas sp. K1W22B-7]